MLVFWFFRISINSAMKWHWSTWIQAKLSRSGRPPSGPLLSPGPSFPRIETIPHMNVEVLDLKCEEVCCLDCCGHDDGWTWSETGLQRTARLHCPADLSTVELWTLTLLLRLSPLLSLCTFRRELDRSHTPALTWHIFYPTSTLMYFTLQSSALSHRCFTCFNRFFYGFF